LPYDPYKSFTAISGLMIINHALIENPSFSPNNIKELIALARQQPGKLSAGTPGVGTPHHLALMMMNALAKIEIVPVPYRGAAASVNDLLAGQIPMTWAAPTSAMPHVIAGKAKVLGVASPQRLPSLPQVSTIAESGLPGFGIEIFFGIAAPGKTPPDLVARLSKELGAIVALPDVQERIRRAGLVPTYLDSKPFAALIRSDHERFGKIIRDAGIKPN
jgi:tripartite-type tricarboxylate transporter receptor subunit TctC